MKTSDPVSGPAIPGPSGPSGLSLRPALDWCGDHLVILDQTRLPGEEIRRQLRTVPDVVDAIRSLAVRGAPAIGVCGAYGVVIGLQSGMPLEEAVRTVSTARPTAVNLVWAVQRVAEAAGRGLDQALAEAKRIHEEDREACRRIAEHGRLELAGRDRIMTHCNTGRLATTGIGTALGIVYAKAQAGEPVEVIATETRPLLQGARLTVWELRDAGVPVTLIADSAAAAALHDHRVDAVIVGCDRVAANGDVANKIGTRALAILAKDAGIPFYVAGPRSSFDMATPTGDAIVIEERAGDEVAEGVAVWNPAFDVTPASLVTAFITEDGVQDPSDVARG